MSEKQITLSEKLAHEIGFVNCDFNSRDLLGNTYIYKGTIQELKAAMLWASNEPLPSEERALCRVLSADDFGFYIQCYKTINNPLL